jgi:hypothetical protein
MGVVRVMLVDGFFKWLRHSAFVAKACHLRGCMSAEHGLAQQGCCQPLAGVNSSIEACCVSS